MRGDTFETCPVHPTIALGPEGRCPTCDELERNPPEVDK